MFTSFSILQLQRGWQHWGEGGGNSGWRPQPGLSQSGNSERIHEQYAGTELCKLFLPISNTAAPIFAKILNGKSTLAFGINYINYGTFTEADPTGLITGSFTCADYTMNATYSYMIDSLFTVGINIKPIYSVYETYTSFGIASDIGATYQSHDKLFVAGIVFRNMGIELKEYSSSAREGTLALSK